MHALAHLRVPAGRVAAHWFEQSSFAVKDAAGTVVLIDPYFPRRRPPERFIHPTPPLDEAELPADYVLLTHDHSDHTYPESLARIRAASPDCRFVGPHESIARAVAEAGVEPERTAVIRAGEAVDLGGVRAHAVYTKPPGGDPAAGIAPPDVTHLGYVLASGDIRLYITGDPIRTFAEHDELVAAVAALAPAVGFMTTHPTEGEFPLFDGSAAMARRIGLARAVPVHRACFVRRDYDPEAWAAHFPAGGPAPFIMPRDSQSLFP
jgi:L-ascorbate metabolism protein UlaG (beta-lactamase superfamily)